MKTILVIEDQKSQMALMQFYLEKAGHTVVTASNAEDGLEIARRGYTDLIICDINLPGMDGIAFVKLAKADEILKRTPMVAVTAHAFASDHKRCIDAGFDGYFSKPIDPHSFAKQMSMYIN